MCEKWRIGRRIYRLRSTECRPRSWNRDGYFSEMVSKRYTFARRWREQLGTTFDTVKIGNGLKVENEKLRPPYRPFSCCLAVSVWSPILKIFSRKVHLKYTNFYLWMFLWEINFMTSVRNTKCSFTTYYLSNSKTPSKYDRQELDIRNFETSVLFLDYPLRYIGPWIIRTFSFSSLHRASL